MAATEPVFTDLCLAPPLSNAYVSDPCCNRSYAIICHLIRACGYLQAAVRLEYFQCCAPRNVTPIVVEGIINDDFLSSACQTPKCSHNAAQDLLVCLPALSIAD